MNEREMFYEIDTRKHQQAVSDLLSLCVRHLIIRAMRHDASKLVEPERSHYIDPVWELNNEEVPYGSDRYKELTRKMGPGWKHHLAVNDHHWSLSMGQNLFSLLEMLCDWNAAARRRGNDPLLALDNFECSDEVKQIIINTQKVVSLL